METVHQIPGLDRRRKSFPNRLEKDMAHQLWGCCLPKMLDTDMGTPIMGTACQNCCMTIMERTKCLPKMLDTDMGAPIMGTACQNCCMTIMERTKCLPKMLDTDMGAPN